MQKLHLVGLTTDLTGLIFSARKGSKSGGYVVPVDAQLLAVIADTLQRRNGDAVAEGLDTSLLEAEAPPPRPLRTPRPQSALSPREMQARLRAGRTIEEVAKAAGVDATWVEPFAVPILAEQRRVVDRAIALSYAKPRQGPSALPLAASVRRNLADKGLRLTDDEFDAAWGAYHEEDARWVLRFAYTSRGRRQLAEWDVDLREGEVVARNRLASALGHVPSVRRRPRPVTAAPVKKKAPAKKASVAAKKGATMKRAPARSRPRATR